MFFASKVGESRALRQFFRKKVLDTREILPALKEERTEAAKSCVVVKEKSWLPGKKC